MKPFRSELDAFVAFLQEIDAECLAGSSLPQIREKYGLTEQQFATLLDRFAIVPTKVPSLADLPVARAVVPVFLTRRGHWDTKQIASGVLLRISTQSFLLTAAHVTDEMQQGHLLVPGEGDLIPTAGLTACWKPDLGEMRTTDKMDLAYIKLRESTRSRIHPSFSELTLGDISCLENARSVPFATFVGYPVTKAAQRGAICTSEMAKYTGHLWTPDVYERLGYSELSHICIRMRLKKTFNNHYKRRLVAPYPAGISGGAIFAWPIKLAARTHNPQLKLLGIAHSFIRSENCLVGTHIKYFVNAILHNRPRLRPFVERAMDRAIPE
jgi:hypothetical protein